MCQEVLCTESAMIANGQSVEQRIAYIVNERDRLVREAGVVLTEVLDIVLSDWDASTGLSIIDEIEHRFQLHGGSFTFRQVRAGCRQLGLPDNVLATPLLGFGLLIVSEDPHIVVCMKRLFQERLQSLVNNPDVNASNSEYLAVLQDESLLPSEREQAVTNLAVRTLIGMSDTLESLFTFNTAEKRDLAVVRGALFDLQLTDLMKAAIANGNTSELRSIFANASNDGSDLYSAVVSSILNERISELSVPHISAHFNSSEEDMSTPTKGVYHQSSSAAPTDAQTTDQLMTVEQAMKLLSVSRATLWRLEKEGTLLPVRIGRAVRYERASINLYLGRK